MSSPAASPVSLCLIVKNEARHLAACLESVRGLTAEIIVVDTGSTDETVEIARRYGARVFFYPWRGDFSAARNFSLEQATREWILYLDADEQLAAEAGPLLQKLVREPAAEGYFVQIYSATAGGAGTQVLKHRGLRLFRNRAGYRFCGALHEQILPAIKAVNPAAKILPSGLVVLHRGYLAKEIEVKGKTVRNLEILRQQEAENPDDPNVLYNLAVALYEAGDREGAGAQFQKACRILGPQAGAAPTLIRNYAICLLELKKFPAALEVLAAGTENHPRYTDLFYLQAQAFRRLGRLAEARRALEKCLELGEAPEEYVTTRGTGGYLALYLLGQVAEETRDLLTAVDAYTRAVGARDDFTPPLYALARVFMRILSAGKAVKEALLARFSFSSPAAALLLADVLAAAGAWAEALLTVNGVLESAARVPEGTALLKGRCLLQLGRYAEAREQFAAVRPGSPHFALSRRLLCHSLWLAEPPQNAALVLLRPDGFNPAELGVYRAFNDFLIASNLPEDVRTALDREEIYRLAGDLLQAGSRPRAEQALRLLFPAGEKELAYHLGEVYFRLGRTQEAADWLLAALEQGVSHHRLYSLLGRICREHGILDQAEMLLRQALAIEPAQAEDYRELARIFLLQAGRAYVQGLKQFPAHPVLEKKLNELREWLANE